MTKQHATVKMGNYTIVSCAIPAHPKAWRATYEVRDHLGAVIKRPVELAKMFQRGEDALAAASAAGRRTVYCMPRLPALRS